MDSHLIWDERLNVARPVCIRLFIQNKAVIWDGLALIILEVNAVCKRLRFDFSVFVLLVEICVYHLFIYNWRMLKSTLQKIVFDAGHVELLVKDLTVVV
jgi:hypothetical protein